MDHKPIFEPYWPMDDMPVQAVARAFRLPSIGFVDGVTDVETEEEELGWSQLPETILLLFSRVASYSAISQLAFTCKRLFQILTSLARNPEFWHHHASQILKIDTRQLNFLPSILPLRYIVKGGEMKEDPWLMTVLVNSTVENKSRVIDYICDGKKS